VRGRPLPWTARIAVPAAAAAMLAATLGGCAKMSAALDKQWMTVQFSTNTTMGTALHVRAACSHIQNAPPLALPAKRSLINDMYGIRFDTTNASPANLAQLQTCLQKFKSVLGVNPQSAADAGS
jgi:hypothetical protein